MAEQIRRDPEQPGPGVRALGVEPEPDIERLGERLSREIVGQIGSDTAGEVAMDSVVVPVEDGREHERICS